MAMFKRKAKPLKQASLKRPRKDVESLEDLPWKSISRSTATGFEGDDGILMLEEVEGVEVVYEETAAGKVARFKVAEASEESLDGDNAETDVKSSNSAERVATSEPSTSQLGSTANPEQDITEEPEEVNFDVEKLLPQWSTHGLSKKLLSSLYSQGFSSPTAIQAKALPVAMSGKDVIGVAETGSGKTLAYGLPILNYVLTELRGSPKKPAQKRQLSALILAPTRELALQVMNHLKACVETPQAPVTCENEGSSNTVGSKTKRPPAVSVAAIVGGMSAQKQRRLLDRGVDILVATPGRLWDILEEDHELAEQLSKLRFLILDEADRMIETGHFAELENIVRLTMRQEKTDDEIPQLDEDAPAESSAGVDSSANMQTFVFSATLSRDLQQNLKKSRRRVGDDSQKRKKSGKPSSTLDELLLKLDFRDPEPEVIDLSPVGGVVSTLQESRIECLSGDKDVYLYYFLLRYPGRSLVFLSSIDGIRRLLPILELLQLKAFPLHSQLQQRQRLKNLDRFKSTPNAILLATDIAARGLDVPSVEHVIHYQIPRSADSYIHRNGRTARAKREGFSLLMCAPDERKVVRALMSSLGRGDEDDIPEMPIEMDLLDKLKARVQLARKIDATQHKVKKEKHEKNWLQETAEAMEIELDSDFAESDDDEGVASKNRKKRNLENQTASMKAELKHLIAQPLLAKGISAKYLTSGAKDVVNNLLSSKGHDVMVGYVMEDAKHVLAKGKKATRTKPKLAKSRPNGNKAGSQAQEEWTGIDD